MIKIDSCIIVKNEENNISPLLDQLLQFSSEIHITDTGSTDATVSIIEDYAKKYHNIFVNHFNWIYDFSAARNFSLNYDNDTSEFKFWCDADDQLSDKLLQMLIDIAQNGDYNTMNGAYGIRYVYYNGDKNPYFRIPLFKTNSGFKWNDPIHEYLSFDQSTIHNYNYFTDDAVIIHKRAEGVSHNDRNLQIFKNAEAENKQFTSRMYHYYGMELYQAGDERAYEILTKSLYCEEHRDPQNLVRSLCTMYIIDKDNNGWINEAYRVMSLGICRGDLLYYIGNWYMKRELLELAKMFYKSALTFRIPKSLTFGLNNMDITINPLLQLGVIYANFEHDLNKALMCNKSVLDYDPDNQTAKSNIAILYKLINEQNIKNTEM